MKKSIKNEEAQAGVGTLIIFIAMVLVAAVAAAVLIQTQGQMNAKASSTTKAASVAIGENINIVAIDGVDNTTNLIGLNISIQAAPGSSSIDLSKVLVKVNGQNYNYSITPIPNGVSNVFQVYAVKIANSGSAALTTTGINSYSNLAGPSIGPGDLARLDLSTANIGGLTQNTAVTISLTPQSGATVTNPVTLPAFSNTNISIYP